MQSTEARSQELDYRYSITNSRSPFTVLLLLATCFLLLASCSSAGQFTLTDTTDDFGVKVLEGTPITLRQGGYDVGVIMTPEMRDNDLEQIMFIHIEHKGKKPHQFTSMSIVIENLPLHYVDLLDYETETTENHVYERFSLKVDFRDLEMILDSKFLRFNGKLNTMGFFLDDGPRRHLRTFRDACLARVEN